MLIKPSATAWCKLAAIKCGFSASTPRAIGPTFGRGNNSTRCIADYRAVLCRPESRARTAPSAPVWHGSEAPWPAVSSVYDECHHGWQPSRSMIYTLPIAEGTCRRVTTCRRRSAELFRAWVALDVSTHNDTDVWNSTAGEPRKHFWGTRIEHVFHLTRRLCYFKTILSFWLPSPVIFYCSHREINNLPLGDSKPNLWNVLDGLILSWWRAEYMGAVS